MDTADRHSKIEPGERFPLENADEGWGTLSNWVAEQSEDPSRFDESLAFSHRPKFAAAGIAALLFGLGILGLTQLADSGQPPERETAISDAPEEMTETPSTDIQNVSPLLEEASDAADTSKI